jgi:hypothetical protein
MPTCLYAYMPICLYAYMPTCLHTYITTAYSIRPDRPPSVLPQYAWTTYACPLHG